MISENSNAIKDSILKAAEDVFGKFGYKKTTLDDIARHIGKGKSALYYYYKNKEEIFDAVLDFESGKVRHELLLAVEAGKDPQEKLRCYILKRMELFHQLVTFHSIIQHECAESTAVADKIRKQYDALELELISRIIKDGIDRGEIKKSDVMPMACAIIKAMKGFEISYLKEKDKEKLEHDADELLELLLYGLVPRE